MSAFDLKILKFNNGIVKKGGVSDAQIGCVEVQQWSPTNVLHNTVPLQTSLYTSAGKKNRTGVQYF